MSIITSFPSPAGPQTRMSPLGPIQPLAALQPSPQELPAIALRAVETSATIRPTVKKVVVKEVVVKEFEAPKPAALPPNDVDGIVLDHIPFLFDDANLLDDLPRPEPLPAPKQKPEVEAKPAEAKQIEAKQPDTAEKLHQTAERGYLASRDAQRAEEPVEIKLPSDEAKPEAKPAEEPAENLVKKLAENLQPVED